MHRLLLITAVSALLTLSQSVQLFHGDQVLKITPKTEEQLVFLKKVQAADEFDFWTHLTQLNKAVSIHVTKEHLEKFKAALDRENMSYEVAVDDVQKLVNSEKTPSHRYALYDTLLTYAPEQEISMWLESTATRCGSRCELLDIGASYEGRGMRVIKIMGVDNSQNKPVAFVDGGIHAREWISPVFVNNMIQKLIDDYGRDPEVTAMVDAYDWYVLPLLNPDGYQYSHESDRMWRKNRAPTTRRRCTGVDLNRNFGYKWGVAGVSSNPCSDIYPGPEAFSEPESRALRDFLSGLSNLKVYLTFHSYGQYFLYPWGYGREYTPNNDDLDEVGLAAAAKIRSVSGDSWIVGNSAIALYPAAGASDDFAYSLGAPYSYCIELPPNDDGIGFILPESRIPEVVSSVWPGVKTMMQTIMQKEGVARAQRSNVQTEEMGLLMKLLAKYN